MKDLPNFQRRTPEFVRRYAENVLTSGDTIHLRDIVTYPEGYYRAIFSPGYFKLAAGSETPTKSQWNTLKKKFKHHDLRAFVLKETGTVDCDGEPCYYIEFGFFAE